jgi:hypothetical protein
MTTYAINTFDEDDFGPKVTRVPNIGSFTMVLVGTSGGGTVPIDTGPGIGDPSASQRISVWGGN